MLLVIVGARNGADDAAGPVPPRPGVLLVVVGVVVVVEVVLAGEVELFVGVQVAEVGLLEGERAVGRRLAKPEDGCELVPAGAGVDLLKVKIKLLDFRSYSEADTIHG